MIEISITDFRNNIKYYSEKVVDEDILVLNNGKPVMRISNPNKHRLEIAKSLMGCVNHPNVDVDKIMENKLKEL